MDLSFEEINEFRVQDILDLADIYIGEEKPREAAQEDIDRFFG